MSNNNFFSTLNCELVLTSNNNSPSYRESTVQQNESVTLREKSYVFLKVGKNNITSEVKRKYNDEPLVELDNVKRRKI